VRFMFGANEKIIECLQSGGEEERLRSLLDFIREESSSTKDIVTHLADMNPVPGKQNDEK